MTGYMMAERVAAKASAELTRTLFPDAEPEVRAVLMQVARKPILTAVLAALTLARKGRRRVSLRPSNN